MTGFRVRVNREVDELFSTAGSGVGPAEWRRKRDSLPEPIRRYLRFAIPEGAPAVRTARLQHGGFFRTKPGQRWLPIEAEQYFSVGKPGFVWNARVHMGPLWIDARDRLQSGRGSMLVKLCSIWPIANAAGAQIDQGASARWLAETVWFPSAVLGDSIACDGIDVQSSRLTLIRQDGLPVSVIVEIDEEGKLVRVSGERYRDLGAGRAALTSWSGRCSEYAEFDGFRVPTFVEVGWDLPDGDFTYVRFRVTKLEYRFQDDLPRGIPGAKPHPEDHR